MPITRADVVAKAVSILQEVGTGQSIADEDKELIDDAFGGLVDGLLSTGVLSNLNEDDIFPSVYLPLARLLANAVGDDYGRPYSDDARAIHEATIRRVVMPAPVYSTLATDYF